MGDYRTDEGLLTGAQLIEVQMSSTHTDRDDEDEEPEVPAEVIDGIKDIAEGRTADEDDLDEALDL